MKRKGCGFLSTVFCDFLPPRLPDLKTQFLQLLEVRWFNHYHVVPVLGLYPLYASDLASFLTGVLQCPANPAIDID